MKNSRFLMKYSLRNLGRNPRRSFILFLALTLTCTFIIWSFNLNETGLDEMSGQITGQYVGKYQISDPKFEYLNAELRPYHFLTKTTFPLDEFPDLAPRILVPVYVTGKNKTIGTIMVGIDPEKEKKISKFYSAIGSGTFLSSTKAPGKTLLLGGRLAHMLNLKIGDEVAILGQGIDGSIANDLFTLVGLLDFGGGDLEQNILMVPIQDAQEFMSMPSDSFHLVVGQDESLLSRIDPVKYKITSWRKILPDVNLSVKFMYKFNWALSIIMVFVIGLGVSNTLFVSFNERKKEIETLSILGAPSGWITLNLLMEVYILMILSLIIGNILGLAITSFFTHYPIDLRLFTEGKDIFMGGLRVNPLVRPQTFWQGHVGSSLLIFLFVNLSLIYPLYRVLQGQQRASEDT